MVQLQARSCIENVVFVGLILFGMQWLRADASDVQYVINQEFQFRVAFPSNTRVCVAASGDHPHGFFIRLNSDQKDCGVWPTLSAIGVQAHSNSTFENSPDEEIARLCPKTDGDDDANMMKGLKFYGHRSARCRSRRADGSIDIYVVTQAGQWPGVHDTQELNAPYINYIASLHTMQDRMPKDIKMFRMVLNSVRIGCARANGAKPGGTEYLRK